MSCAASLSADYRVESACVLSANTRSLEVPEIRRKSWLETDVPLILAALQEQGVTDKDILAYALATAEFETGQGIAMVEIGRPN